MKALLVGVFVNKLGWFLQVFLVLFLTTSKGFTPVQAGTALGVYGAGSVIGLIIGGSLSDKVGPRAAVMISMFGMAGFVLAIAYVPSYTAVVVVVALAGAVGQFYRPASAALLTELTPQNRQVMTFAIYRLTMNLGTTAAPLIGAALVAVSWNLLFIGEALAALAYAAVAIVALPGRKKVAPAEPGATVEPEPKGSYLAVLRDHKYVLFLVCMFINAAIYMQYLAVLPLHMKADGLSTWWYSAMVALNGFIVITCELLVTKVVQNKPARTVAMTGFVLLGGGLAFYALPGGPGDLRDRHAALDAGRDHRRADHVRLSRHGRAEAVARPVRRWCARDVRSRLRARPVLRRVVVEQRPGRRCGCGVAFSVRSGSCSRTSGWPGPRRTRPPSRPRSR